MRAAKFSWVAWPNRTLLSRAAICRHYRLALRGIDGFGETIDAGTDRPRSDPLAPSLHFDACNPLENSPQMNSHIWIRYKRTSVPKIKSLDTTTQEASVCSGLLSHN